MKSRMRVRVRFFGEVLNESEVLSEVLNESEVLSEVLNESENEV